MKKTTLIIIASLCASISLHAQKTHKLSFSGSPYGHAQIKLSMDGEKYKYDFKNLTRGGLEYDYTNGFMSCLTEVDYFRGSYDKMDLGSKVSTEHFDPNCKEDLYGASLTQYIGAVINPRGGLQIPIYLGIGMDYVNNKDFLHHFTGDLAAKVRIKLNVGNLNLFVGGSGRAGFGVKGSSDYNGYNITSIMWNLEGGIGLRL